MAIFESDLWNKPEMGELYARWPKLENGEPEEPVYLCHCKNINFSDTIRINMLEAYGIPCLYFYPGYGAFSKLILGVSGEGTDIYVPAGMYDDAAALCKEENNDEL